MTDPRSLEAWAADETADERANQGLPLTVEDPVALDHLATILTSATPIDSRAPRRGASGSVGSGAVGGSGEWTSQHAGRSKPKKKAGVAVTTPAPNTSTPVEGVRRQA